MMNLFPRGISGKTIFVALVSAMVIHLVVMVLVTHVDRQARIEVAHDNMVQKVFDAVYLIGVTPESGHEKAITPFRSPNFKITISEEPRYDHHFNAGNYWEISNELYKHLDDFSISIRLENNKWLNIHALVRTNALLIQLLLVILELFIVAVIIGWAWSINRFVTPLQNFKSAAERLGVDMNTKPLRVEYGPAIVKETAEAMNLMQQRIRDLIRDRTQMLAAISHDLRTPITRLKLRAQYFSDSEHYPKMIHDLDEMESMIAEVLQFAKHDVQEEEMVKLDLPSLLSTLCDDMQEMGDDVTFECEIPHITIKARSLALKRAFTNLLNNAVKYGNSAVVQLEKRRGYAVVTIDDNGPGISEEKLPEVFSPFFRAEPSRSRDTGGVGLGLTVVRDIIRSHHGEVTLSNRKGGGLRARVLLRI